MYILKQRISRTTGVFDSYLSTCVWMLGAVTPQFTFDKDKAKQFDTKQEAINFRDDNLTGSWVAINK